MDLLRNISRVVITNFITLISSILLGFVLPKVLSVESYGQYRLFLFYASYIGFFHFGFIDAIYLKYGGIDKDSVIKEILKKEYKIFIYFQFIVFLVGLLIAFVFKNKILFLVTLTIIPMNMSTFHKFFYQATGQFKKFSRQGIFYTVINLVLTGILIILTIKNSYYFIVSSVIAYGILWSFMELDFKKFTKGVRPAGTVDFINYIRKGIFILLGNLCFLIITSLGTWIVNIFFTIKDFGHFSFSVSLMNIVLTLIGAVGLTFYNYISKKEDQRVLIVTKEILLVLGTVSGSAYFILYFIIVNYLPAYVPSLKIIAISFVVLPYAMVVNVIISNLYKARKQEVKYFKVMLKVLLVGVAMHLLSYMIFRSITAIAFATVFTFIFWYFYTIYFEFPFIGINKRDLILQIVHFILFLVCTNILKCEIGAPLYISTMLIMVFILYKETFKYLITRVKKIRYN